MSDRTTPAIAAILKRLEHPGLKTIDLSLDRMLRLLAAMDNPERRIAPVVHIAGTNGKGSLVAYLQAIFQTTGYKVHRYTSPHLVRFNERIVIAGNPIDDTSLLALVTEMEALIKTCPATYFESTTAAAFKTFAEKQADVTLLEVGMGGRFDATNVIDTPMLTCITPVSIDHAQYLGGTLPEIAGEKAGIMKAGVPCVVGPQEGAASEVIEARAVKLNAPLYRHGKEWHVAREANGFHYRSLSHDLHLPTPNLHGEHQVFNAGTAIACIDALQHFARPPGFKITGKNLAEGITHAVWPGRLQKLAQGPLQDHMPENCELWLDGGHNPGAGTILAGWAGNMASQPLYLVLGMLHDKDAGGFLAPIAPHLRAVYTVPIPAEPKSQEVTRLAGIAEKLGVSAHTSTSVADALQLIQMQANRPYRVLISGSLYLAGAVLAENC